MTADIEYFVCNRCAPAFQQVTLAHKDSVNTQFYNCPVHGFITATDVSKKNTKDADQHDKSLRQAFEIQAEQNGEKWIDPLKPFAGFCDEKGIFKPALVAMWLKANHKFKTDRETDILYYYDGKHWVKDAESYVKEWTVNLLGEETRKSYYDNILFYLKAATYETITFSNKIACDNGLLDVETGEFTDFNADEMPFYNIPVTYDATATCPNWEEFVKQVVNPDDVNTLQEWSGYLLLPDYRFHKIMWIVGNGRNGKGVWQRTLEAILGLSNVSNVGLEEFDGNHRFALYQLYGKLFNPCSEPSTKNVLQTSLLKYATGQDTIEAERKGTQARLKFKNCAKITVLANKFPRVNDQTVAFKERRLFLKFPFEFTGTNQIQNLEKVWLNNPQEKSGVLNWIIAGLQRLLTQARFTESKTQQETETEFLRHSDTISAFINEMGTIDKALSTLRSDAYDAYKIYCDFYGLENESSEKFTQRLKDTPKVGVCQLKDKEGKYQRGWKGIAFKIVSESEEEKEKQTTLANTLNTENTPSQTPLTFENSKSREVSNGVFTVLSVLTENRLDKNLPNHKFQPVADSSAKGNLTPEFDGRTCGDCARFHLLSCEYPTGEIDKVPRDKWAGELRCFLVPQPDLANFDDKAGVD